MRTTESWTTETIMKRPGLAGIGVVLLTAMSLARWAQADGLSRPASETASKAPAGAPIEQEFQSLRAAIVDLVADFGARYPDGAAFLRQLDALSPRLTAADPPSQQAARGEFEALRRKALTANPLVSQSPILFVVRQQYAKDHHNTGTDFQPGEISHKNYRPGGALKVLDLAHEARPRTLLATERGVIRDPDVHFDGQRLVFAMRHDETEAFQIYEMRADGTGLTRLTQSTPHTDLDPAYLADDQIVFASTRDPKYCGCNRHVQCNLFVMDADGGRVRQISRNNLFDSRPSLLADGRILYDRWEYVDSMYGPRFGLWTVNPDGTQHALYCGNNDWAPGAIFDAREISGTEQAVAVFGACHDRPWGALVVLDRRRGLEGMPPVVRLLAGRHPPLHARPAPVSAGRQQHLDDRHVPPLAPEIRRPLPLADRATGRGAGKYFLCARTLELQHPLTSHCVRTWTCPGMTDGKEQTGIFLVDIFGNELLLHAEAAGLLRSHAAGPASPAGRDSVAGRLRADHRHLLRGRRLPRLGHGAGAARHSQVAARRRSPAETQLDAFDVGPGHQPGPGDELQLHQQQANPRRCAGRRRWLGLRRGPGRSLRLLPAPRSRQDDGPVDAQRGDPHAGRAGRLRRLSRATPGGDAVRGCGGCQGPCTARPAAFSPGMARRVSSTT